MRNPSDYKECTECPEEQYERGVCLRHLYEMAPNINFTPKQRDIIARHIRAERKPKSVLHNIFSGLGDAYRQGAAIEREMAAGREW